MFHIKAVPFSKMNILLYIHFLHSDRVYRNQQIMLQIIRSIKIKQLVTVSQLIHDARIVLAYISCQ